MRIVYIALLVLVSSPALADLTHSIDARFGVGYRVDPSNPEGQLQSLYEGRYTSTFTHQADNGLRFRFDFGIEIGNFEPHRPSELLLLRAQRQEFFE